MTKPGKFIVVEGLEGAGKSTAISRIKQTLDNNNITYCTTREPGGTGLGERIRGILTAPDTRIPIEDHAELLLFYAARMQLISQVIRPALQQGQWVIGDRFELSTFAYQGGGRQLNPDFIQGISQLCLNGFKPDLTIYLDIKPERGLKRIKRRGHQDRIEQESLAFFERVHAMYEQYRRNDPQIIRIDANQRLEQVSFELQNLLQHYIAQWEQPA